MKKLIFPMLVAAGAICALRVQAADDRQIDWNLVPGGHGRNDVSRDFVAAPDPLNTILSNNFTAWEPKQPLIQQAGTTTGRDQRHAVLGNPNATTAGSNVAYTTETKATTQAAPSAGEQSSGGQALYSESPQAQNQAGQADQNVATPGATGNDKKEQVQSEAKAQLAPHALIIESSLTSARDQVRGIKGEMNLTQDLNKVDKTAIKTYQTLIREMRNDINVARVHEKQLISDMRRYPELAKSEEYRSLSPALLDLQTSLSNWEGKASDAKYWNNQQQAKADINSLEKQFNNALSKVKNFNSGKLNASLG